MSDPTPEEQQRFETGVKRIEEICAEIASDLTWRPSPAKAQRIWELTQEAKKLIRKLEIIAPLPKFPLLEALADAKKQANAVSKTFIVSRDPTPGQVEAIAFMLQLKTRQGTVMPDFEAFYRERSELDREISGRDDPP
jgi:hypothetical protein